MVRMIALVALALAGADAFAPVPLPASSVSPAARGMGRAVVGGWAATSTRARPTGTSSLMMGLKIGVVGAGPGGLATALALQKVLKPESVTVLERSHDNTPAVSGEGKQPRLGHEKTTPLSQNILIISCSEPCKFVAAGALS
jgi:hypothetical protein